VYNAENFLKPTIQSLLTQTYQNFEAIIVDDGSKDASMEIVERLAASDQRIRIFRQKNTGVAGALNRGLQESRGEFIAFLDHDDLWKADKLARQLACFEMDESLGLVGCYSALIDSCGTCLGWRFGTAASGNVYRRMLFCDLVAGGSVAMVRKTAFEQSGHFDSALEIQGRSDWDQWIRIRNGEGCIGWIYPQPREFLPRLSTHGKCGRGCIEQGCGQRSRH
jgi:glycosyltransferase involved in cell wall biosynthesis